MTHESICPTVQANNGWPGHRSALPARHCQTNCIGGATGGLLRVANPDITIKPDEVDALKRLQTIRRALVGAACLAVVAALALEGCAAREARFDGEQAYRHVLKQCDYGPRPVGSDAGRRTAAYIVTELDRVGWETEEQRFFYRGVMGCNVIGKWGRGPLLLLGAHYDTRSRADRDPDQPEEGVLGANDGASGVAVLLELARSLDVPKTGREVWLVFFDAEDQGNIDGWPFAVGASYMAEALTVMPEAVVIVDMVGDAEQEIYWEGNSDPELLGEIWAIAAELGYEVHFVPQYRYQIVDDHIPFRDRGLPALDIIDFDYRYWHTTEDTADKVSPQSLERVGRVLEDWLEGRPWDPSQEQGVIESR